MIEIVPNFRVCALVQANVRACVCVCASVRVFHMTGTDYRWGAFLRAQWASFAEYSSHRAARTVLFFFFLRFVKGVCQDVHPQTNGALTDRGARLGSGVGEPAACDGSGSSAKLVPAPCRRETAPHRCSLNL